MKPSTFKRWSKGMLLFKSLCTDHTHRSPRANAGTASSWPNNFTTG